MRTEDIKNKANIIVDWRNDYQKRSEIVTHYQNLIKLDRKKKEIKN